MNLAIIIAVSNYANPSYNLPGCFGDALLMQNLLNQTNKYRDDELLCLFEETESLNVKEELTSFIEKHKGKEVNELFFYYTGHGEFFNNDFYYLLSDFDTSKRRQTSLNNSETDNLLKQLAPHLIIKVIDACQSGVMYIKNNNHDFVQKHLDESKEQFKKCYFMFSSMLNQSSWVNNQFSYFTKSFVDSILKSNFNSMRYKYIIDYISDEFENNPIYNQKPFFVTQADFTEIFCNFTPSIKSSLLEDLESFLTEQNNQINNQHFLEDDSREIKQEQVKISLLEELIKEQAQEYCTEDEFLEILEEIKNHVKNHQYSLDLTKLYNVVCQLEGDYTSAKPPISRGIVSIGKWLQENNSNYFANILYGTRPKYGIDRDFLDSIDTSNTYAEQQLLAAGIYERFIKAFELNVEVPFQLISISTEPKYPNVNLHKCRIIFVFSQVYIRFFYIYETYKLKNWNLYYYSPEESYDWQTVEEKLKEPEKLELTLTSILEEFDSFILDPLRAKFDLSS